MAHLSVPARTNSSRTDGGLSRGAVVGIAVGAGAGGVFLIVALVLALVWWRGKGGGYYSYDFGAAEPASTVTGLRSTDSTIALRGGPSQKSVLRMSITGIASRRDRGARGRRMGRADSLASLASVASEDGIAAPELSAPEKIGGSGVGFLDERGNPIVRRHSSFEMVRVGEEGGSSMEL